jgi:hypothetical protein
MRTSTAIGRNQFRWPAMWAKTEAELMGESRLRHAEVVFRFIEQISNVHGRVSVGREIFARGPKLVGYEANGKQCGMKSINVHTRHLNRQSYETITVVCQFCEFNLNRA